MKLKSLLYKGLITLFIFFFTAAHSEPSDSLRTETHKGTTSIKYKIDKGNTFYSLSRRFGITVDRIKSFNNISELKIDQIIYLPTKKGSIIPSKGTASIHIVQPGETLYTVSKKNEISVDELKKINHLSSNNLSVGQKLKLNNQTTIASPTNVKKNIGNRTNHIVSKGETLYSIAKKYSITVDELKTWNNLENNGLLLNQSLFVSTPKTNNSSIVKKTVHLINSKSHKLDADMSEVLCTYGNIGDVIQIMYQGKKCFARIVGKSDDTHLYASKKVFDKLNIKTFSQDVDLMFNKKN